MRRTRPGILEGKHWVIGADDALGLGLLVSNLVHDDAQPAVRDLARFVGVGSKPRDA